MIWTISDIFVVMFAISAALNLMIVLLAVSRPCLERTFNMRQLSKLLKFFLLYMAVPLPALICCALYMAVFGRAYLAGSPDISRFYILKARTIGTSTPLGNHFILFALLCLWVIGFVYKALKDTIKIQQALRQLDQFRKAGEHKPFLALMEAEKDLLKIKRATKLFVHNMIPAPFMLGLFQTRIFLPEKNLSDSQVKLILDHELIHCKHNDYPYRRLLFFLCSLYWFNPLIYKLADYFIEVNEMACDEAVLCGKDNREQRMYANLILQMAEEMFSANEAIGFTGRTTCPLERRIIHIMKKPAVPKKISLLLLSAGVAVSCTISAAAAATGTVALQHAAAKNYEDRSSCPEPLQEHSFMEYTSSSDEKHIEVRKLDITPRDATWIDYDIHGRERIVTNSVHLSDSAEVTFYIKADSTGSKFRAGIMDSNQTMRYITSSDGKINHTFTIRKADDYTFFIEGTTTSDIHVSGSIIVIN